MKIQQKIIKMGLQVKFLKSKDLMVKIAILYYFLKNSF